MGHYYVDMACPDCGLISKDCACPRPQPRPPVCECPSGAFCKHRKQAMAKEVREAFQAHAAAKEYSK